MKTAIVCEGGGMRGVYTSGVLQSFLEAGFLADELIGVSAGASNGTSYVSGQKGRGLRTNVDYINDKRYLSVRRLLRTGSIFGMDFLFDTLPNVLDPFDYDAFHASPCKFYAGVTDINTGKAVYFGKEDMDKQWIALRASCSIPMMAKIVPFKGGQYMDGGVAAPIPVHKAIADGAERILIVLTRPRGYQKQPTSGRALYSRKYKQYPALVRGLDERHNVYNTALQLVNRLESEGKAIIIAPPAPLPVDRLGRDREALTAAYRIGIACGEDALKKL